MSLASPPFATRPREHQFVGDLESLFRRLRVPIGTPECLETLAAELAANDRLRSDLFALCNAISRMSESDLAAEELLALVTRAAGGPGALSPEDGEPATLESLRSAFLPGFRQWQARTESLASLGWNEPPSVPQPAERLARFAAAASRSPRPRAAHPGPSRPAPGAAVTPETPIGELTISQLRSYLDDIEQRVERLQPYLASIRAELPAAEAALAYTAPPPPRAPEPVELNPQSAPEPLPELSDSLPETPAATAEEAVPATPSANQPVPAPEELPGPLAGKEEPVLPLRSTTRPAEVFEPVLFRSVSEPPTGRSKGFLWAAAVLALLAPATYYGRQYWNQPPSSMTAAPPPVPSYPPAELTLPAEPPTPAASRSPQPHSGTRALGFATDTESRAVRMEAQAARAQETDSTPK